LLPPGACKARACLDTPRDAKHCFGLGSHIRAGSTMDAVVPDSTAVEGLNTSVAVQWERGHLRG
jgi:hypothetical protein